VSAQGMGPGDMERKPAGLLIFSRATRAGQMGRTSPRMGGP
jgi:hypothetical protein